MNLCMSSIDSICLFILEMAFVVATCENLGEYNLSSIHVLTWKLSTNCFTARPRSPETIAPATYHKTWVNACKKCTIVWKHIFLIKRVVGGGQHDLLFERPGLNFQMLKNRGWVRACTCWWDACSCLLVIQRVSQLNLVILYPQNFMYHGLDEQNNVIFIDI